MLHFISQFDDDDDNNNNNNNKVTTEKAIVCPKMLMPSSLANKW